MKDEKRSKVKELALTVRLSLTVSKGRRLG